MKSVSIEDIAVGDDVLSFDVDKKAMIANKVKAILKFTVNELVHITLSDNTLLVCTAIHPFYVPSKQKWCSVQPANTNDANALIVGDKLFNFEHKLVEITSIEHVHLDDIEVRTLSVVDQDNNNFFANGILCHNKGFPLKIMPARGPSFEVMAELTDTVQAIKLKIQMQEGIHCENQTLMFAGLPLQDDKILFECGISGGMTIHLLVKEDEDEMGIAAGGKMKQKIYKDDKENLGKYNVKKVTRVFVNIANGNMWKKITGKVLPASPLNPQIYKNYGYPWFELYDDGLNDLDKADNLANVKSIKQLENAADKVWNCPICTFENVAKNMICCMCQQGKKPNANDDESDNSIKVVEDKDVHKIEHPDNDKNKKKDTDDVDQGDW